MAVKTRKAPVARPTGADISLGFQATRLARAAGFEPTPDQRTMLRRLITEVGYDEALEKVKQVLAEIGESSSDAVFQ